MPTIDCVQLSPEWLQLRIGRATGSRAGDAVAVLKRKEGESAARRNYRYELVIERLTGKPFEHYVSQAMKEGTEKEPLAKLAYELETGVTPQDVGFVTHHTISMLVINPNSWACFAERLTGATSGPNVNIAWPARTSERIAPHSNSGEEMALGKASQLFGSDLLNISSINFSRRYHARRHQIFQPFHVELVVFVVVGGHKTCT